MRRKKKINIKRIIILIILLIISFYAIHTLIKKYNYNVDAVFPSEVYGVKVTTRLVETGTKARTGRKRKIKYIVIHETANTKAGATAENHAIYLSDNNKTSTAWHYTVDDKEIYHHIPDDEIAYHAATDKGNQYGIGIELCVNEDGNFEKAFENRCKTYRIFTKRI